MPLPACLKIVAALGGLLSPHEEVQEAWTGAAEAAVDRALQLLQADGSQLQEPALRSAFLAAVGALCSDEQSQAACSSGFVWLLALPPIKLHLSFRMWPSQVGRLDDMLRDKTRRRLFCALPAAALKVCWLLNGSSVRK